METADRDGGRRFFLRWRVYFVVEELPLPIEPLELGEVELDEPLPLMPDDVLLGELEELLLGELEELPEAPELELDLK